MHGDFAENGKGKTDDEAYGVHDDLAGNCKGKIRLMMKLTVCMVILLRTVKIRLTRKLTVCMMILLRTVKVKQDRC